MRSYWIRVGPNPMTSIFLIRENRDTDTHNEEGHVKTEAEFGAMLAKAKECLSYQKLGERYGEDNPLPFRRLASRAVRKEKPAVLSSKFAAVGHSSPGHQ